MICDVRLRQYSNLPQWTLQNGAAVENHQYGRAVVVRLLSAGQKFKTKDGWIRDSREHDDDTVGMEYEVQFVDGRGEVARFFTIDQRLAKELNAAGRGNTVAIGWRRDEWGLFNTAWQVDR